MSHYKFAIDSGNFDILILGICQGRMKTWGLNKIIPTHEHFLLLIAAYLLKGI